MSRFPALDAEGALDTVTVPLGECQCPGTPHAGGDTAEIVKVLGWDDVIDVGNAPTEGAAQRVLVTRALSSWTLLWLRREGGKQTNDVVPVPINEATVRLLDKATLQAIAEQVNELWERAKEPLPNESGAPSRRSRRGSAS